MSGSGKDVSGVVRISWDEVGAGTFPDTWMDHEHVIEAEKVAAMAHAEAEATKDNKKKKCHLANAAHSWAEEVAMSILTGDDRCGRCVIKSLFVSVPSFPDRG